MLTKQSNCGTKPELKKCNLVLEKQILIFHRNSFPATPETGDVLHDGLQILRFWTHKKMKFMPVMVQLQFTTKPPASPTHTPTSRIGKRIGRAKVRKIIWLRQEQLNWEAKDIHTQAKQKKQLFHCFPLAGRCLALPRKGGLHQV